MKAYADVVEDEKFVPSAVRAEYLKYRRKAKRLNNLFIIGRCELLLVSGVVRRVSLGVENKLETCSLGGECTVCIGAVVLDVHSAFYLIRMDNVPYLVVNAPCTLAAGVMAQAAIIEKGGDWTMELINRQLVY